MKKFELGQLVATAGVSEKMHEDKGFYNLVARSLGRYMTCDWGDTCAEDAKLNDEAVKNDERILAVYKNTSGTTIWIITECDRSSTTILFPHEY